MVDRESPALSPQADFIGRDFFHLYNKLSNDFLTLVSEQIIFRTAIYATVFASVPFSAKRYCTAFCIGEFFCTLFYYINTILIHKVTIQVSFRPLFQITVPISVILFLSVPFFVSVLAQKFS